MWSEELKFNIFGLIVKGTGKKQTKCMSLEQRLNSEEAVTELYFTKE